MHITHVATTLDPSYGGPLAVVLQLASAQAAMDNHNNKVSIVSAYPENRKTEVSTNLDTVAGIDRVTMYVNCFQQDTGLVQRVLHFYKAISKIGQLDIVHIHGVWDKELVATILACKRRNIPYVICAHGMLDLWSLDQKKWKKKIALALIYKRLFLHASAIHTLNEYEKNTIARLRLNDTLFILHNGVDLDHVRHQDVATDQINTLTTQDQPFALFLGRLHYKKGLDLLAQAWVHVVTKHPQGRLVIAGPQEDNIMHEFWEIIDKAKQRDSVSEVGSVYSSDKNLLLTTCSMFVLPSRQEGFSIAILEAMAAKKPVVITHDCHFPDVKEVGAGLTCNLQPTLISEAMLTLFQEPETRTEMGDRGYSLVKERYTWIQIAIDAQETYLSLLAKA